MIGDASLPPGRSMVCPAEIAERVIQSILSRQLRPGERLGEQALSDLFGVSRTVVREGLIKLQTRGFVVVRPRLGWYVAEPSYADAQETYAARRVVEPGMLRDAGRPLQSVIRRLRQHVAAERDAIACCDAGTGTGTGSLMFADFHICLAEALGNRLLTGMMVELCARTTLVAALYQSPRQAQVSTDDHAAIVEALADGDGAAAERLMREHIDMLTARLDDSLAHTGKAYDRLRHALAPDGPGSRDRLAA